MLTLLLGFDEPNGVNNKLPAAGLTRLVINMPSRLFFLVFFFIPCQILQHIHYIKQQKGTNPLQDYMFLSSSTLEITALLFLFL